MPWLPLAQEAIQFSGKIARLPFEKLAGDAQDLVCTVSGPYLPDVIFLDNGGVVVMGEDIGSAFSRLCDLERCCQVTLCSQERGLRYAHHDSCCKRFRFSQAHGCSAKSARAGIFLIIVIFFMWCLDQVQVLAQATGKAGVKPSSTSVKAKQVLVFYDFMMIVPVLASW